MTWQPVVQDMLNILQSPLADEQKINMLILVGYSEDDATKLVKNK